MPTKGRHKSDVFRKALLYTIPVNEIFERHEASLKVVYEYY